MLKAITDNRVRTMVMLAGCLGLSRSELTGLQWGDFNWQDSTLTVRRGVVNNHVGNPKTIARQKLVPLAPEIVTALKGTTRQERVSG